MTQGNGHVFSAKAAVTQGNGSVFTATVWALGLAGEPLEHAGLVLVVPAVQSEDRLARLDLVVADRAERRLLA